MIHTPSRSQPPLELTLAVKNVVLSTLPEAEFETLRPFLKSVELRRGESLQQTTKPTMSAHFIESGIVSRVAQTSLDGPVETTMVGRYGFIGTSVVLGFDLPLQRAVVRLPGRALRISTEDLNHAIIETPSIKEHLLRHISVLLMMKAQVSLCNAKHDTQRRTARWLLGARDQTENNRITITQGRLASALGVRRVSVASALKRFECLGALKHERGCLTITNSEGMGQLACGCYSIIDEQLASLKAMKQYAHRIKAY